MATTSFTASLILKGQSIHTIKEVPFIVQLHNNIFDEVVCGGTILNTLLVITAAHCIYDQESESDYGPEVFTIIAGELRRKAAGSRSQTRKIVQYFKPTPSYNHVTHENDLVILLLSSPLVFSKRVGKVRLSNDPVPDRRVFGRVYGWGNTETNGVPDSLLKTTVRLMSTQKCKEHYPVQSYNFPLKMICARGDQNMASCKGDSWSPFFCLNPIRLCGITSFGEDIACLNSTKPVVYVNVISYMSWIQNVLDQIPDFQDQKLGRSDDGAVLNLTDGDVGNFFERSGIPSSAHAPAHAQPQNQFQCAENSIPNSQRCDEMIDCANGADELGCAECGSEEIICAGKCHKRANFCYFEQNDGGFQCDGGHFRFCFGPLQPEWRFDYFKTAMNVCQLQEICEAGAEFRCVKCSVKVSCTGNCMNSLEVCTFKRRLAG